MTDHISTETLELFKRDTKCLHKELSSRGVETILSTVREAMSATFGFDNYRALHAAITTKAKTVTTLPVADLAHDDAPTIIAWLHALLETTPAPLLLEADHVMLAVEGVVPALVELRDTMGEPLTPHILLSCFTLRKYIGASLDMRLSEEVRRRITYVLESHPDYLAGIRPERQPETAVHHWHRSQSLLRRLLVQHYEITHIPSPVDLEATPFNPLDYCTRYINCLPCPSTPSREVIPGFLTFTFPLPVENPSRIVEGKDTVDTIECSLRITNSGAKRGSLMLCITAPQLLDDTPCERADVSLNAVAPMNVRRYYKVIGGADVVKVTNIAECVFLGISGLVDRLREMGITVTPIEYEVVMSLNNSIQ